MAISRPFAYNTGASILGTTQVGTLAVGTPTSGFTNSPQFWNGPDEDLGYVIAAPQSGNTQPTPISGVTASVQFFRTKTFTGGEFISLSQYVSNKFGTPQILSYVNDASTWLTANGYWNSWIFLTPTPTPTPSITPTNTITPTPTPTPTPTSTPAAPVITSGLTLNLDAGNPASYPTTGTSWTDTVGGKVFTLFNGPTYTTSNGGYIQFVASSSQYAFATSLASALTNYTVEVWHLFNGTLTGAAPVLFGEGRSTPYSNFMMGTTAGRVSPLKIQGGFWNGSWQQGTTDPGDYFQPSNGWYQFVNTYDGSNIKFYANNTLQITKTPSNFTISSSGLGLNIMRRQDVANYWGGGVSIVRIYDRALSQAEITQNYNAIKSRFGL